MTWRGYSGAPAEGSVLCRADDIAEGDVKSLTLGASSFPVLIVRSGGEARVYVNACPHQYLPLDHRGDRMLSADGAILRCTNHGAGFRVADGEGVEGLGIGCALDRIPTEVGQDGILRIAAPPDCLPDDLVNRRKEL